MRAMQIQPTPVLRRWCRECGRPSPVSQPGCVHCNVVATAPSRAARVFSPILNEGNGMVQNNVVNIDTDVLVGALGLDDEMVEPRSQSPGFFHRFFMFTCAVAMWCGIFTFSSVVVCFFIIVYLAVQKAHGG